jgi:hypothetical protein
MAVSQADIRFLSQNFPGAAVIPADQVRDLASQMGITFSDDFNAMLEQGSPEIRLDNLQQDAPAVDIDISDIPLTLNGGPAPQPQSRPGNAPPPIDIPPVDQYDNPSLAQYDDIIGAESGMESDYDYADPAYFGLNPEPLDPGQPFAPNESPLAPAPEPRPLPEPTSARFIPPVSQAFTDFASNDDIEALEDNEKYGTPAFLKKMIFEHLNAGLVKLENYEPMPHRFLTADQMRDRIAKEEADFGAGISAYELSRKRINGIRYLGKGIANVATFAKENNLEFFEDARIAHAETIFTNRTAHDQAREAAMAEQNENNVENDVDRANEQGREAPGEGVGQSPEATSTPEPSKPGQNAIKALDALQSIAEGGMADYSVVESMFRQYGVSEDEPVFQKLKEDRVSEHGIFDIEGLKNYATAYPESKPPTSQPAQSTNAHENDAKKEEEMEKDLQKKHDPNGKDGPEKPNLTQVQSGVVGAGFNFMGGLGQWAGYGAAKAGSGALTAGKSAVGGVKNVAGFIKQNQERKRAFSQTVETSISHLSNSLDSVAGDRADMKKAGNMFERKQIADRMGSKLSEIEKVTNSLADTLSTPAGIKAVKKGGMTNRLEALQDKFDNTMKTMEPGKGEVKAFENIKESMEAVMKSVQRLLQAIASIFKGPERESAPSLGNGPG